MLMWLTRGCCGQSFQSGSSITHTAAVFQLILTHQSAESHHGKESLQKDAKGVHKGAVLATPVIRARRRGGRCRRVDQGDSGDLCPTRTCYALELGGHVGTAHSTNRTGLLDKKLNQSSDSSNVMWSPVLSCSWWSTNWCIKPNRVQQGWWHSLRSRHKLIILQTLVQL